MITACKESAPCAPFAASTGSVKPKSAALKVCEPSSSTAMLALVPAGASLTAVTLKVSVFGVWSVFWPLLAVPPSSTTWNVKLA